VKAFFKRLFCIHERRGWRILHISFNGATIIECKRCGKRKSIPLK